MALSALIAGVVALASAAVGFTAPALIAAGVALVLATTGYTRAKQHGDKGLALSVIGGAIGGFAGLTLITGLFG